MKEALLLALTQLGVSEAETQHGARGLQPRSRVLAEEPFGSRKWESLRMPFGNGSFYELGVRVSGVLPVRALLFRVHIGAPDLFKLSFSDSRLGSRDLRLPKLRGCLGTESELCLEVQGSCVQARTVVMSHLQAP